MKMFIITKCFLVTDLGFSKYRTMFPARRTGLISLFLLLDLLLFLYFALSFLLRLQALCWIKMEIMVTFISSIHSGSFLLFLPSILSYFVSLFSLDPCLLVFVHRGVVVSGALTAFSFQECQMCVSIFLCCSITHLWFTMLFHNRLFSVILVLCIYHKAQRQLIFLNDYKWCSMKISLINSLKSRINKPSISFQE